VHFGKRKNMINYQLGYTSLGVEGDIEKERGNGGESGKITEVKLQKVRNVSGIRIQSK